ncbi:MAG: gliding motility-associated C-terminal domain-containing protein [Bacteroidota bacterium]
MDQTTRNTGIFIPKKHFVNVSLILFFALFGRAQESYNQCSQALEICPLVPVQVNNIAANITFCTPCDDNFSSCFTPNNTIWMKFTTNSTGGFTQIDFSNLVFESSAGQDTEAQATILRANAPCDATTYSLQGNCITNATGNFTLTANLAANTTYYVVANGAKNGPGITKAAEFTADVFLSGAGVVRITPSIVADFQAFYCKNEIATFVAHLDNCPDSTEYRWFINDTLAGVTQDSVFQTTVLKNGDVLSVSNSCFTQCTVHPVSATPPLFVFDFVLDAGPDFMINYGQSVGLVGTTDATAFHWSPPGLVSNPGILDPVAYPKITTTYYLTGELNGCSKTDAMTVTVGLTLEITNTFTPNDDGSNDTWNIPGLVNYPNCFVQIFDRWGQQVYNATGYNAKKAWDGTKNGKELNEGVYYYTIELRDGSEDVLTGYLNLIR